MIECPRCGGGTLFLQEERETGELLSKRLWDATCSCGFNECSVVSQEDLLILLETKRQEFAAAKGKKQEEEEEAMPEISKKDRGKQIEAKIEKTAGMPITELLREAKGSKEKKKALVALAGEAGASAPGEFINHRIALLPEEKSKPKAGEVLPSSPSPPASSVEALPPQTAPALLDKLFALRSLVFSFTTGEILDLRRRMAQGETAEAICQLAEGLFFLEEGGPRP